MNRHAPIQHAAAAALVALAACAGTDAGPSAPAVPGADGPYPPLAGVPERPPTPSRAELRRMREELIGSGTSAGRAGAPRAPEAGRISPEPARPEASANRGGARSGGPLRAPALLPSPDGAGPPIGEVRFASGSAALDVRGSGTVARLAEIRRRCGGTLRVVAHAGLSVGADGRLGEFRLAVRRANAVAAGLRRSVGAEARPEIAVTGAPPGTVPPETADGGRVAVYLLDQTGNPPPDRRRTRWKCRDGT